MFDIVSTVFDSDKQAPALYLQVAATIFIGLLAWLAATGQNAIAEKMARKELFSLRYKNIYQETDPPRRSLPKALVAEMDFNERRELALEKLRNYPA